jgi:aldose 1-epimerase
MRLTAGAYRAEIAPLGSTLHSLTVEGADLVVPATEGDPLRVFRGAIVAPWPNRVVDGRYRFAGVDHQLPLNEVARGHALHGFSHDWTWSTVSASASRAVLGLDLPPQPGYPFRLRLETTYTLSDAGLRVELMARNVGDMPAPYGCTIHPYLTCGTAHVDDAVLELAAATRLEVADRMIPAGTAPVESVDCDFRGGDVIGPRLIDHAFTDLTALADGTMAAELRDPAGNRGVRMTWGPWARWVQVHTADRPEPAADRVGLALEPMSCAPDAFNSGDGLVVLDPAAEHHAWWTIGTSG